jgi:hypothetical protein
MSADRAPTSPPVYPIFGGLGVALTAVFALRLVPMLGPAGDQRVAVIDLIGIGLALVPSWGLILWRDRRPLKAAAGWLFGALLSLAFLPPLAYFVRR